MANPKEIQARVGNSRLVTTMDAYAHVTKKMKNEAVDIFAQRLKKIFDLKCKKFAQVKTWANIGRIFLNFTNFGS